MIIRSQDKSKITNFNLVSDLTIFKNKVNTYDIIACYPYFAESDCGYTTIATYSTEEKAIKVLDMICDFYSEHLEELKCDEAPFVRVFFSMPQDCEVQNERIYRKADW